MNFTSPVACHNCFHSMTLARAARAARGTPNMLISDFKQASHQGLAENLALFLEKASTFDPLHKPHVFSEGAEIPLSLACARFLPPEILPPQTLAALAATEDAKPRTRENTLKFEFPQKHSEKSLAAQVEVGGTLADIDQDLLNCVHVGPSAEIDEIDPNIFNRCEVCSIYINMSSISATVLQPIQCFQFLSRAHCTTLVLPCTSQGDGGVMVFRL